MAIKTFKRYELKYFVTPQQYESLCEGFIPHMVLDTHCLKEAYSIHNIYFDTENNDIIRKSLSKPYYKEKLRLRSYKMPSPGDDMVFLELKKKIGGIVAKRRAVMHYGEAMEMVTHGTLPVCDNYQDKQVVSEIQEFLSRYTVSPKVYISYERIAFFDKDDGEFRVSFDKNILTRRNNVNLRGSYGIPLLKDGRYLMEVKCIGAIPVWMSKLLSELKIYRTNFSKYGTEYKRFIAVPTKHEVA